MAALASRTALVTGAGRGIGRETAKAFAMAGWQVVAGVRDPSGTEPFVKGGVHVLGLDVTDHASVRSGVKQAEEIAGGPLACVVNNTGWALFGAVEDLDLNLARQEFETNVFTDQEPHRGGRVLVVQDGPRRWGPERRSGFVSCAER